MKHLVIGLAVALAATALVASIASAEPSDGNGAPSGAHYNLNIIGVPKDKTADMTGNNGRRIFVKLWGPDSKILLTEGDFQVLDANGTDGVAAFQLPNPDPDGDGTTVYSVYARALGTPGGKSTTTTCFDDVSTDDTYCSIYQMILVRDDKGGKSTFTNYSRELLYVYRDIDADGIVDERVPLFGTDDDADQFFWDYNNEGLKLAQLRFYEIPTTVSEP